MKTISLNTPSEQCNWFQTLAGASLRHLCVAFFPFRLVSRMSHSCAVGSETQARCSIGCFYLFLCSSSQHWLCYLWDCSVSVDGAGHASDGENRDLGTFVLFLVQYAVHKSLALQILRFLLISFVVKWVHCCFFSIKSLWTTERSSAYILFFISSFTLFTNRSRLASRYLNQFSFYWHSFPFSPNDVITPLIWTNWWTAPGSGRIIAVSGPVLGH